MQPLPMPIRRQWPGAIVVVAATGPSLCVEDCEEVDHEQGMRDKVRVIAVNDAWRLLPRADALYACDHDWWAHHAGAVKAGFDGQLWSCDEQAAKAHGLNRALGWTQFQQALGVAKPDPGPRNLLSCDARYIGFGGNSTFQALNLAVHFGAARIVLLGLDLSLAPDGRRHFFGDHPRPLARDSNYGDMIKAFDAAAPVLEALGIDVVNASRRTALQCFRRAALAEALADSPSPCPLPVGERVGSAA